MTRSRHALALTAALASIIVSSPDIVRGFFCPDIQGTGRAYSITAGRIDTQS